MQFDWDPAKEESNKQKHGFGFVRATAVFDDPFVLVEESTRPEFGERRMKAIGRIDSVIVTVIYTDRGGRRRIISVRRAKRYERRKYDRSPTTS